MRLEFCKENANWWTKNTAINVYNLICFTNFMFEFNQIYFFWFIAPEAHSIRISAERIIFQSHSRFIVFWIGVLNIEVIIILLSLLVFKSGEDYWIEFFDEINSNQVLINLLIASICQFSPTAVFATIFKQLEFWIRRTKRKY